jgi:hypothetical protein
VTAEPASASSFGYPLGMRPRPEPSDLAASLPRMGDTPFAPSARAVRFQETLRHVERAQANVLRRDPAREAADAAEQQAIADAVEGVIP